MAKLEILEGPDAGRTYELGGGRLLVGRGLECEVRLNEGSISRHHAALECVGNTWFVEDLNSANGVFVAGEPVARQALSGRVALQFGKIATVFDATAHLPDWAPPARAPEVPRPAPPASAPPADWMQSPELNDRALAEIRGMGQVYARLEAEFSRVIVGQKQVLEELLVALAAGGHCLMIGLPGLGKTLMVNTLARILRLRFKRIQFTPDLMPSDIIGTDVLEVNEDTGQKSFRFIPGPIFANLLLADEINRTPPKTQSALLEAMQERQVTVANHVFPLPPPFFVLATQNPLEQEGTYPLPEAQLDRFMFNIIVDYPAEAEEEQIVMATTGRQDPDLQEILTAEHLLALQAMVRRLPVSPHVVKYATRLVRLTRPKAAEAPRFIKDYVHVGAGPRAAQFLILGAKARAVLQGRLNVEAADVQALALPVLRHRIFTTFAADSEGIGPDELVTQLLAAVPEPGAKDY